MGKESRSPPLLLESNGNFTLSQEGACLMSFPWILMLLHPHSCYSLPMSSKNTIKITKNPLNSESVLSKSLVRVLRGCERPAGPGQLLSVSLWPAAATVPPWALQSKDPRSWAFLKVEGVSHWFKELMT